MQLSFSGNKALILGGSCSIAIDLAKLLIQNNIHPILTFRSQKGVQIIERDLQDYIGKFKTIYLKLDDLQSLENAFESIKSNIDFLIDFIQEDIEGLIASANMDNIECYFSNNVSFRARILKKVARKMIKQKQGRMIFISSAAAYKPNPGQGFYAASKLASEALYNNIGIELGSKGITTIILRPGYINAGRGKEYIEKYKDFLSKVPVKRAITIDEVAETILFFMSDSSKSFNATKIIMDGGLTACK